MPPELIAALEKQGLKISDLTPEQIAELKAVYDATVKAKPATPASPARTGAEPTAVLSDEERAKIDALQATVGTIVQSLKSVTDYIAQQNTTAADQQKAAQEAAYKGSVEKAVKDGRLTRAKADELLKPETMAKNIPALDVFTAGLDMLSPDPRLRNDNAGKPDGSTPPKPNEPNPQSIDAIREQARAAAAAKFEPQP